MVKRLLNGSDLAGFIQERQSRQVRGLRQAQDISPKLAIVQVKDDAVIDIYVRLKKTYGADILIDVDVHRIDQSKAAETIKTLNDDPSVHGIIVQLPLADPSETDALCDLVAPNKDVDALGDPEAPWPSGVRGSWFEPATPMAIMWLLAGYNVDLKGKKILLIGHGKLVGKPLAKSLKDSGHDVTVADRSTENLSNLTLDADIIITAAGSPALIFPDMIKEKAVIVDAGVASEDGKTVGDVAPEVYERDDLIVTPVKGGVGPLTVCALFENVIRAASAGAKNQ